jgi:putative ABC transport system permease protein
MLNSIFRSAFRNLQKRRTNTLLSLLGLTVGFSSFILISLFIKYELSWDSYHEDYDRIYRVQTDITSQNEKIMQTSPALYAYLDNKFADIERHGIVKPNEKLFLSANAEDEIIEEEGQYADQGYLDMFSFDFVEGSGENALINPMSIVISTSLANKLFRGESSVGKTIILQKKQTLKVIGVFEDMPKNSHLRPEFIISFSTLEILWNRKDIFDQWDWNAYYNYILLRKGADYRNVDAGIKDVLKDKVLTDYRELYLRPLSKLYMYSTNDNYMIVIYILSLFSLFVLILASINYINISIASATTRGKEIGIKKVIGSSRRLLMVQVFLESMMVTFFSFVLSLILVELSLGIFNDATGIQTTFSLLFKDGLIIYLLAGIILIGIISSAYPAWIISSFKSIDLFKNSFSGDNKGIPLKKVLVGFQFTVSIVLITLSILLTKQIRYTQKMDVGFKKSNLLFTEIIPSGEKLTFNQVKNQLNDIPEIREKSASGGFPIHSSIYVGQSMMNWEGGARNEVAEVRAFWASYDYVNTLGLEIIKGRNFSEAYPSDIKNACIINETAVKAFGWDDPIGKMINNRELKVIGVIKDMHFHDMYNVIKPLMIRVRDDNAIINGPVFFAFRVNSEDINSLRGRIEVELKELFPEDPFVVEIFNDHFKTAEIFEVYQTINSVFIFFAFIAVILSILGVVGLVNHTLNRKTKEIAIRKISGCSSISMFTSISMEYLALILISTVVGSLGAGYLYNLFPINYPFELNVMDFLYAGIIILILTILATGHKTWRESTRNPVHALRYE